MAKLFVYGFARARYEDCQKPPHVSNSVTTLQNNGTSIIHVNYKCLNGYLLKGKANLLCDIRRKQWSDEPPKCMPIISEGSHSIIKRDDEHSTIAEDIDVTYELSQILDLSCIEQTIKAPEIANAYILKYERRRKDDKIFLVAIYECDENSDFENNDINRLYCSQRNWLGKLPVCIPLTEYIEEDDDNETEDEDDEEVEEEVIEENYEKDYNVYDNTVNNNTGLNVLTSFNKTIHYNRNDERNMTSKISANHIVTFDINNAISSENVDEFTPKLLGPCSIDDKNDCEHICERVLYAEENEPRQQCACYEGFTLDPYDFTHCIDINECDVPHIANECPHGCENIEGSYKCMEATNNIIGIQNVKLCDSVYRFHENHCVDIDECSENIRGCITCHSTIGKVTCTCSTDYKTKNDICIECELDKNVDNIHKICSHGCRNTEGSFECYCPNKYHLDDDHFTCIPDSCKDLKNPLLNKTDCSYDCIDLTEESTYTCICPEDKILAEDGVNCVKRMKNICVDNVINCSPGNCMPLDNETDYYCICPSGFIENNKTCNDINECLNGNHNCSHNCVNTDGAYYCQCPEGFTYRDSTLQACEDINECLKQPNVCGKLNCVNYEGGFECSCLNDYELDESTGLCMLKIVMNPCKNHTCSHECIPKADNTSYYCSCPENMMLDSSLHNCLHIDFCLMNNNDCEHICNSLDNGSCSCYEGYILDINDKKSCLDIDECLHDNGGCHHVCINLKGSFSCSCFAGYKLADDLVTCTDMDECLLGLNNCSHDCLNIEGSYKCICPDGFYLSANKSVCLDLNECLAVYHGCSHECINLLGSYRCACPMGFLLDKRDNKTCVADSKCLINNGNCSHLCNDRDGCSCPTGWYLKDDGKTCEDINECLINNGDCEFQCLNIIGSHECRCLDGTKQILGNKCPPICPAGFTFAPDDSYTCVDIDECSITDICEFGCRNTNGTYECYCPTGYKLHNEKYCVDINECLENVNSCFGGQCINEIGGFRCECSTGYYLANNRQSCLKKALLKDLCLSFEVPQNGKIHCTKFRYKQQHYYQTRCKVWCNEGYRLIGPNVRHCNSSGHWDNYQNLCLPTICPALSPPQYGRILPHTCINDKTYKGERCHLQCNPGYQPIKDSITICTRQMQWSHNGTFECQKKKFNNNLYNANNFTTAALYTKPIASNYSNIWHTLSTANLKKPFIKCPRNTTIFLANNEKTVHVVLQRPITNLDYSLIKSSPSWTKKLQGHLKPGIHRITFKGYEPRTGQVVAHCQTIIEVKHAKAPSILYCTPSFEVTLPKNQLYRSVIWNEPIFEANLDRLMKIYKSRIPGELFGRGIHTIVYEAITERGLNSRCEFHIIVKAKDGPSEFTVKDDFHYLNKASANIPSIYNAKNPNPPITPFPTSMMNNNRQYLYDTSEIKWFSFRKDQLPPASMYHFNSLRDSHQSNLYRNVGETKEKEKQINNLSDRKSFVKCPEQSPIKMTHSQAVSYSGPEGLIRSHYAFLHKLHKPSNKNYLQEEMEIQKKRL